MKNILNLTLGIQGGHFYKCPHVKGFDSVDVDPNCHCEKQSYRLVLGIGLTMFVLEFFGGILTNSLSLVGDSLHLLADSTAIIIGLVVLWAVARNKKKEGDYRKWAVIFNGSLLLLSALYLLFESFFKFLYPSCTAGIAMTIVATIGIVGNYLQHHILMTVKGERDDKDLVHKSIVLHIFSDLLQSFAVVIGGVCIIFSTDLRKACIIDPMLSTAIGGIMAVYAINLIFKAFQQEGRASMDGARHDSAESHDHHGHHH